MLQTYFCGALLSQFENIGVMEYLYNGITNPRVIAEAEGLDAASLELLFEFIYRNCNVFNKVGIQYSLAENYRSYKSLGFNLDKFINGYSPLIEDLGAILGKARMRNFDPMTNSAALAKAFDRIDFRYHPIPAILQHWNVLSLLDLGCSSGLLLEELCRQQDEFFAWGIERNPHSCKRAKDRLKDCEVSPRIKIYEGSVLNIEDLIARSELDQIQCLYGSSIMNEFFHSGSNAAIEFLTYLKTLFPGRLFFIVDYYGQLNNAYKEKQDFTHAMLQDLVQVLSGQGIPPSDQFGWMEIYAAAGCELLHVYASESTTIQTFVHVIRL